MKIKNICLISALSTMLLIVGVGVKQSFAQVAANLLRATNFIRTSSNTCTRAIGTTVSATVITTSCNAVNLNSVYGIPTNASVIYGNFNLILYSGTSTGTPTVIVRAFSDSGCTNYLGGQGFGNINHDLVCWASYSPITSPGFQMAGYQVGSIYINGQTTIYLKMIDYPLAGSPGDVANLIDIFAYSN